MIFQNIELLETDKFQYLLIHKNGSSSVSKCMESLNFNLTNRIDLGKIRWTVIRDPYERECCNSNKEDIKINLDKKQIMKHLDLDYYIYNKILNSSYLWKWQFGKIF